MKYFLPFMNIDIFIPARLDSSRLPKKIEKINKKWLRNYNHEMEILK